MNSFETVWRIRKNMDLTVESQWWSTPGILAASQQEVSPFGDLRINGCLPPSRSLSQAATSFIGFFSQGIHHTHFVYPENRTSTLLGRFPCISTR